MYLRKHKETYHVFGETYRVFIVGGLALARIWLLRNYSV